MAHHELAEGPLQLLLVDVVGAGDQLQQGVAERGGVAVPEREDQVLQCGPLLGVEAADRAEVDQGEAAVGEQQHVARMRVGVEHAALGDLVDHAAQQHPGQLGPVKPAVVDQLPCRAQADPVQPFDDEHVLGAQLLIHGGKHHRDAARDGTLLAGPGGGDGRHVARLHPEVELFPHGGGEPAGHAGRADRTRPAGAVLERVRQAQQDVQVLVDGGPDPGALDLHGHLGVRAVAAAQPGLVNLGDRCGRGRFRPQLREDLPHRCPLRLGDHRLHLFPRCGLGPVLKPGELGDELVRQQVTTGGHQLAQLDERNPALFQGLPQRPRERRPAAGLVLATPSPPAQVGAQPMPHGDPADLRITP